jgi:hypothetical protein
VVKGSTGRLDDVDVDCGCEGPVAWPQRSFTAERGRRSEAAILLSGCSDARPGHFQIEFEHCGSRSGAAVDFADPERARLKRPTGWRLGKRLRAACDQRKRMRTMIQRREPQTMASSPLKTACDMRTNIRTDR